MRAVQAALALLLAAAGAKNHGDELALFVRQYAEKNDRKTVDVHRLAAAADAHRKRIRDHYGFDDDVGKKNRRVHDVWERHEGPRKKAARRD